MAGVLLLSATVAMAALAEPPRLVVHPHGTNQLEFVASHLQTDAPYMVLARTNSPTGYWIMLTGIIGSSNATVTIRYDLSGAGPTKGLTVHNLANWTFVIGASDDSDGDGLPDVYEDLATRTDPYSGDDGYSDPDGDNWSNIQEMQNNTNPLAADHPPQPQGDIRYTLNRVGTNGGFGTNGTATLTWHHWGNPPDYFLVERAERRFRPPPNPPNPPRPGQRRPYRSPLDRPEDPCITGPFREAARVLPRPELHDYRYVETNIDTFCSPVYRLSAHYTPPFHAYLEQVNETTIRQTILPIAARPTTNGYDLTATHPIPYAWYLLLVRDRNNPQWRASGYFTAGTNRNPVFLHVDAKGMMSGGQSPIAMPEVHFLANVVDPEFTAGWGEDSDGDGLPDIYEVLVTQTDPTKADTGNTGILDGYKEMTGDGWSNLEKFRRRADPRQPAHPPPAVELIRPTLMEAMRALATKTDLRYEPQITMRKSGGAYQPLQQPLQMFYYAISPRDPRNARVDFDLRVLWRLPQPPPRSRGYSGP